MAKNTICKYLENKDSTVIFNAEILLIHNNKITEASFPRYISSINPSLHCLRFTKHYKQLLRELRNKITTQLSNAQTTNQINKGYKTLTLLDNLIRYDFANMHCRGRPDFLIYNTKTYDILFCEFKSQVDTIKPSQLVWREKFSNYPHLIALVIPN